MPFLNTVWDWVQTYEGRAICLVFLAIVLAAGGVVEVYVGRCVPRWKKNVAILSFGLIFWVVVGTLIVLFNR